MEEIEAAGFHVKALDNIPELFPSVGIIWDAFQLIKDRREFDPFGDPRLISLKEIEVSTRIYGIYGPDSVELLSQLDYFYLQWIKENKDANTESSD